MFHPFRFEKKIKYLIVLNISNFNSFSHINSFFFVCFNSISIKENVFGIYSVFKWTISLTISRVYGLIMQSLNWLYEQKSGWTCPDKKREKKYIESKKMRIYRRDITYYYADHDRAATAPLVCWYIGWCGAICVWQSSSSYIQTVSSCTATIVLYVFIKEKERIRNVAIARLGHRLQHRSISFDLIASGW